MVSDGFPQAAGNLYLFLRYTRVNGKLAHNIDGGLSIGWLIHARGIDAQCLSDFLQLIAGITQTSEKAVNYCKYPSLALTPK